MIIWKIFGADFLLNPRSSDFRRSDEDRAAHSTNQYSVNLRIELKHQLIAAEIDKARKKEMTEVRAIVCGSFSDCWTSSSTIFLSPARIWR